MQTNIIIGLGFGDEGKGLFTDFLCRQVPTADSAVVVRFSGGHQAGHTVADGTGRRHVFSHFGAGSFCGVPTYWSKWCTYCPQAMLSELAALRQLSVEPVLFVDGLCPVTTPYDQLYNQLLETARNAQAHGSCGVGIGATIERQEAYYHLFAQDLAYETVFRAKLANIYLYYAQKVALLPTAQQAEFAAFDPQKIADYMVNIGYEANRWVRVVNEADFFAQKHFQHYIFEGSQGVLLDKDFGFFPNVTRSNTVSKQAVQMVQQYGLPPAQLNYISRGYQTRHGNGFMTNEDLALHLPQPNARETNVTHRFQGKFRQTVLDVDLLNYALRCDAAAFGSQIPKNLVLTCLDQTGDELHFTQQKRLHTSHYSQLGQHLQQSFQGHFYSFGDTAAHLR